MKGTLALSWGSWGGFYITRSRICLGFAAVTLLRHHEIDDLMEAYVEAEDLRARASRERTWRYEAVDYERAHGRIPLRELLSACKQWRQATESRLRLIGNREMSDVLLEPDKALFEAIDRAEKS